MTRQTVFVIACNDSTQHVVKGTREQAQTKLVELKEAYFQTNRWSFGQTEEFQRAKFAIQCYWHMREIAFTEYPTP